MKFMQSENKITFLNN